MKLGQIYQGVPLYASEISLHFSPNNEIILTGRYQTTPSLQDMDPDITVDGAIQIAEIDLGNKVHVRELTEDEQELLSYVGPESELVVYQTKSFVKEQRLAWHLTP